MATEMRVDVVRGRPDAVELAAVMAVLLALLRAGAGRPVDATEPVRAPWRPAGARYRPPVTWSGR
ncbi:acyl-CoA carboxylase subunit epsilon [Streptomyces sp. URMC 123]|uniref:acyl-CoA carboxylase subunit epsilon n=1 Tax=Streptomyces sp. URMC 123 TaxID=3423403 RepID=UPI003F1B04E8